MVRRITVFQLRKNPRPFLSASMRHTPTRAVWEDGDLKEQTQSEHGLETWSGSTCEYELMWSRSEEHTDW